MRATIYDGRRMLVQFEWYEGRLTSKRWKILESELLECMGYATESCVLDLVIENGETNQMSYRAYCFMRRTAEGCRISGHIAEKYTGRIIRTFHDARSYWKGDITI